MGFSETAMATHSSILAWKIPWTEEPGRLQSMGSLRIGHDWATFTFHFHALEKEMATHSSVLAWRIPGMGETGGLLSMGLHRVRHNWSDLAAAAVGFFLHFSSPLTQKCKLWFLSLTLHLWLLLFLSIFYFRSLGLDDSLEKGEATHSSILGLPW